MSSKQNQVAGRRRFLRGGAVLGASLAAGARAEPLTVAPWSKTPGEPVLWHPYGEPSPFEKNPVVSSSSHAWPLLKPCSASHERCRTSST